MTFNLADLWQALRSRMMLVITVAGAIFALAVVLALVQPRKYVSTSSLLVDLTQTDQSDNTTPQSASIIDSIIGTQVSVLKSELVLDEVTRRSGLITEPNNQAAFEQAQKRIASNLNVVTDRQSNVISISFVDEDPEVAARIANLFADTFLQKQVELRVNPARVNAQWYDARTAEVRGRFEQAQQRLTDFQRANGILGIDRMDLEAERMKSLTAELSAAGAAAADARAKAAGAANMPEVASALSVQGIQQQVATKAAEVAQLSKTLGPNHPQMRAAQAELSTLQGQLGSARGVQASALSGAGVAAQRREADLRARLAAQQERMLRMSSVQDQLAVLQRDVDAARQTYDTVRARFNDASIKTEVSRANTTILDRASAPLLPFKPNLILWIIGGALLGVLSGIGLALVLEILSPRVRSASGLAKATSTDVLADLANLPRSGRALRRI
ncbi:GNVR domain-containing protein [Sphingomonas hankookensis]|uniref:GNVR domain-containing protein n=1 Tax=Sphingomonas hankookensis TaxID=563996 RepID=UPI001F5AD7F6|nr:GNVR domain-containing protein [Sphingomonas hankookensis]